MERVELEVEPREPAGKGGARRLRAVGRVPAVVYGGQNDAIALSVERLRLDRVAARGANQLIDLRGPAGVDGKLVLLKELQRDPVSQQLLHCDFYTVDTSKTIQVDVPIHVEGKAHGVEMGGILEPVLRAIEVECLPLAIPDSLTVDVTALEIGDAVHASEIALPDGVSLLTDGEATVLHVIAPRVEAEPEAEEEAAEGEAAAAPAEGEAAPAEASGEDSGD